MCLASSTAQQQSSPASTWTAASSATSGRENGAQHIARFAMGQSQTNSIAGMLGRALLGKTGGMGIPAANSGQQGVIGASPSYQRRKAAA